MYVENFETAFVDEMCNLTKYNNQPNIHHDGHADDYDLVLT